MENRVLKISKVFFNVLVLDAVQDLIFTTVENKFSGDGTIAMVCLGTFFRVDQMAVLEWGDFPTVLDLKNLAGTSGRIEHHHIKFTNRKLKYKNFLSGVCYLGFQKNNVFQHLSFDLSENTLLHSSTFRQRKGTEDLIQKKTVNQCGCLSVTETGLSDDGSSGLRIYLWKMTDINKSGTYGRTPAPLRWCGGLPNLPVRCIEGLDHNPHMTPSEAEKRNRSLGSKKSILT